MKNIRFSVTFTIIAIFAILIFIDFEIATANKQTYTVTVTDKAVKDNGELYLVFAEDDNKNDMVFKNEDKWILGKFDSSDLQAKLKLNHKYTMQTVGFRVPIFSMYQNILYISELDN